MECLSSSVDLRRWLRQRRGAGESLSLVPTMGYFHEGHLQLMRQAKAAAKHVVVSLFVNPIQFGVNEDLDQYPRDLKRDQELAAKEGVSLLFTPEASAMYPPDFQSSVSVGKLSTGLCGVSRPGHFDGVTTVVAKLFNLIQPDFAVFGEKDFQQLAVIRQMVTDLAWPVEIIAQPIIRETDGLAMSSRNVYLRPEERRAALSLYRSLLLAREILAAGMEDAALIAKKVREFILSHPETDIDYVQLVDALSLEEQDNIDSRTRLVLAVRIGGRVRLLDNGALMDAERDAIK